MYWQLHITFETKSLARKLVTNDIRHGQVAWSDEVFKAPIRQILLHLPQVKESPVPCALVLSGFTAYNFHYECLANLSGSVCIEAIWFHGMRIDKTVQSLRLGRNKNEWSVTESCNPLGKEWNNGPTSGWKKGEAGVICFGLFSAA